MSLIEKPRQTAEALGLLVLADRRPAAADALALAQLVRDSVTAGVARQALHLRISHLGARLRQGHHRRLLREALEPALRPVRSRLFELPNGDLVAVAPPFGAHLRTAEAALAVLFGEGEAAETAIPYAVLNLPGDAALLLAAVEDAFSPPLPPEARADGVAEFSPADLAALEQALRGASLARFLQRHPVCRLDRGGVGPELLWEEWRLDWPGLRAALLPTADPAAAPWLGRRLRRMLDRRLLAELSRPEDGRPGPLGLALAVATLGEAEFLRFDAQLDIAARATTVLALPVEDALADPDGFAFARDFGRARGCRLALDLPGPALLPALPADLLGMDLLRLPWSPALVRTVPPLPPALQDAPGRVVLTGADRATAIGWGWEAGITLFEGRLLRPRG